MKIVLIAIGIAIIGALFVIQDFGSLGPEPEQPVIKRAVDIDKTQSQQEQSQINVIHHTLVYAFHLILQT